MKKLLIILVLCFLVPFGYATEELFETTINLSIGSGNVTVYVEDKTMGPYNCNISTTVKERIYLRRESICEESDIINLTKTLIETNKEVVQNCGTNISYEFIDCIENKSKTIERYGQCLLAKDEYENDSKFCQSDLTASRANSTSWYDEWDSCEKSSGTFRTELNTCKEDVKDEKGKMPLYIIGGLVVGSLIGVAYQKGKTPRPSEEHQFGY